MNWSGDGYQTLGDTHLTRGCHEEECRVYMGGGATVVLVLNHSCLVWWKCYSLAVNHIRYFSTLLLDDRTVFAAYDTLHWKSCSLAGFSPL